MSWTKLIAESRVTAQPPSKAELDNLRSIVDRSLADVNAPGLSADARFNMAYDAARTLSLLIVRAAGYRPRSVGGHYNTFLALEAADQGFAVQSAYFDTCRMRSALTHTSWCSTNSPRFAAAMPSRIADLNFSFSSIRRKAASLNSYPVSVPAC